MRAPRVTLLQVFAGSTAALVLLLGALLALFFAATRRSLLTTAEALRDSAARRIEALVREELDGASRAVRDVEQSIRLGVADPDVPASIESALFAGLVRNPHLAEVTFTRAERNGFDGEGESALAPAGRWQVSVVRTDGGPLVTRYTRPQGSGFSLELRERVEGGGLSSAAFRARGAAPDPTEHLTFRTAASRDYDGVPIWTDLSYAQSDSALPVARRRVVVSVQESIADARGRFAGVVRAGLLTHAIDAISTLRVDDRAATDPHRVFLADPAGHLVTRTAPDDELTDVGDALRVSPRHLPESLAAALGSPVLKQAADDGEERSGELRVGGERWLATFRPLQGTQDWLVGIAVPESAYTGALHALRIRFLIAALAVAALIAAGGGAALLALRRSLGRIGASAARMRQLDFAAAPAQAPFRDVQDVMDGLARAGEVRPHRPGPPALPGQRGADAGRRAARADHPLHRPGRLHRALRAPLAGRAGPRPGRLPRGDDARDSRVVRHRRQVHRRCRDGFLERARAREGARAAGLRRGDQKRTRLNSSHSS